ncbi:putative transporter C11D3.18C-like protein [Cladobotryum mycophilum]|uniref:Transporter C11D3.18C-like protein n=1 Tax=Cladobotryum mycophilum TaxID=491253 RepID=A0ABR0T1Q1_9HYPO
MSYHHPGDESPTFAQTGAEFTLDDDSEGYNEDDDDEDDDEEEEEEEDLRLQAGGGAEAYELVNKRDGSKGRGRGGRGGRGGGSSDAQLQNGNGHARNGGPSGSGHRGRALSVSTAESFQLYTPDEELAVRTKFDRKLVLFVALLYMLSFLDRSNIGNARIAGMDEDLQSNPPRDNWYQWSLTAFYLSYIAFEWMSLLWRIIPAHIYVSMIVLTWGITASFQAVAVSYPMLIALRVVLGIGEAGFTGVPFYLSFFFKRRELAFRTAIFISAAPLATSFASTLAWIIVKLAQFSPIAPWRLLFLIEGFPSVVVSVIAWNIIPDSPKQPLGKDNGETNPPSGLKIRELLAVLRDPISWITPAMLFLTNMAYSSLPRAPYLLAFFIVLFTAHMSDRLGVRTIPIVFHALSSAFGYAILALAEILHMPPFVRYLAIYPAAIGFFNVVTLIIAWNINNQANESRQGGGFALMQIIGQCGPLIGTRLYPDGDAPYYTPGMRACALAMLGVAGLAAVLRVYLQYLNRKMDEAEEARLAAGTTVEEEGLVDPGKKSRQDDTFRYML